MIKFFFLIILLFGCQDFNSNSGDKFRYGPLGLAAGSTAEFTRAYVILQIRCGYCHEHTSWGGYKSEQDWVNAGKVTGGNIAASSVIYKIKNYEGTGSMPTDSGPIPDDEFDSLKAWVESVPP